MKGQSPARSRLACVARCIDTRRRNPARLSAGQDVELTLCGASLRLLAQRRRLEVPS